MRYESITCKVMCSNLAHRLFFIFQLETILRSDSNFSTSYGRSTDLKSLLGLLLISLIWLGENISLKYLLIGEVDVCPPHVQTVSTSLMSKLVNISYSGISLEKDILATPRFLIWFLSILFSSVQFCEIILFRDDVSVSLSDNLTSDFRCNRFRVTETQFL